MPQAQQQEQWQQAGDEIAARFGEQQQAGEQAHEPQWPVRVLAGAVQRQADARQRYEEQRRAHRDEPVQQQQDAGRQGQQQQRPRQALQTGPVAAQPAGQRQQRQPDQQLGQAVVVDGAHHGQVLRQKGDEGRGRQRQPGSSGQGCPCQRPGTVDHAGARQRRKEAQGQQAARAPAVDEGGQQVVERGLMILVLQRGQRSGGSAGKALPGQPAQQRLVPVAGFDERAAARRSGFDQLAQDVIVRRFVGRLPGGRQRGEERGQQQVDCQQQGEAAALRQHDAGPAMLDGPGRRG